MDRLTLSACSGTCFSRKMASVPSLRAKDPELSYAGALAKMRECEREGRVVAFAEFEEAWDRMMAFCKVWGRWRRISRMGSRLRGQRRCVRSVYSDIPWEDERIKNLLGI